jgi:hypothetical protein
MIAGTVLRSERQLARGLANRRGRIRSLRGQDHPIGRTIRLTGVGGNQTDAERGRRGERNVALGCGVAGVVMRQEFAQSAAGIDRGRIRLGVERRDHDKNEQQPNNAPDQRHVRLSA